MKLVLLLNNEKGIRSGYACLDPFAPDVSDGRVRADIFNLTQTVDLGECSEIIALGVADYLPRAAVGPVIDHWGQCLTHGGVLTVSVVDAKEVARKLALGVLKVEDADTLLFGGQVAEWDYRKALHTLGGLIAHTEAAGLRVERKLYDGPYAMVRAVRP